MKLESLSIKGKTILNSKDEEVKVVPIEKPKIIKQYPRPGYSLEEDLEKYKPQSADAFIPSNLFEITKKSGAFFDTDFYLAIQFYKILK
jgi:hypothetical protein